MTFLGAPRHIAIIMDGNGRWAKSRGMIRLMGHRAGVKSVRRIVAECRRLGVEVLTLYAFSTENWQRPKAEVKGLMELLNSFLASELKEMLKHDIRLHTIGQTDKLPKSVGQTLEETMAKTASCRTMVLNLALSYGGRDEMLRAIRTIADNCVQGTIRPEQIDETMMSAHLDTAALPDPDLIIRTGGEARLSNFLLWQSSYAEIYFTDTPWPDFKEVDLQGAINDFHRRQRRFGHTGEQITTAAGALVGSDTP
ncbi:MAG: isoprenyl transferase [Thermodesulfobacteriota bacterium]